MKISCILTSFNRPVWVRQALASVAEQQYRNFELIVIDESTEFNICDALAGFRFPSLLLTHYTVSEDKRSTTNRLSINVNKGLLQASGDLVCFLADDDYLFPGWFEDANSFFIKNKDVVAAFGRLHYSESPDMDFSKSGECRFFESPLTEPFSKLDHNQIIHRRFTPPVLWSEGIESHDLTAPDGKYASVIARYHAFYPIPTDAAVKRKHQKNLQNDIKKNGLSDLGGLRE